MEKAATPTTFDVRRPFSQHCQRMAQVSSSDVVDKILVQATNTDDVHAHDKPPAAATKQDFIPKREVAAMFEKKFKYQPMTEGTGAWQLPVDTTELFSEYYQLEELQVLKQRLNNVKSKLNDYVIEDWSAHTQQNDPAGDVPRHLRREVGAEFVTVAWCKFYECLQQYPLAKGPQLNTLHLCEAPGAFIAALNHYLYSTYEPEEVDWHWLSTTLNPYYEGNPLNKMITDDRFMQHTLDHWLFHDDFTGNIMDRQNIDSMRQQCATRLPHGGDVHLITADGSIDCVETPECQEEYVSQLHFAELCAALQILAEGGCFVLKLFTLFEATSISKVYLLNCVFEQVHVFKPATSKRGNSENYLICLGFRKHQLPQLKATLQIMFSKLEAVEGQVLPMFRKLHLPRTFLMQHEICTRLFMNLQIKAIESNIATYQLPTRFLARRNHTLRTLVKAAYVRRYNLQPLPAQLSIIFRKCQQHDIIQKGNMTFMYRGSYAERQCLKDMTPAEQLFKLRSMLHDFEKSFAARHVIVPSKEEDEAEVEDAAKPNALSLQVVRGKRYESLHSSYFASGALLLFRAKFQSIFQVEPLWQLPAKCYFNEDYDETTAITLTVDTHDFYANQHEFMLRILTHILAARPTQLCFSHYVFLTHFSVSFLRYLSRNCFAQLTITTHPQFEITLQQGVYEPHNLQQLEALQELLQRVDNVMCCVDMQQLHGNAFCESLTEFNNLLLLKILKTMLHQ